MFLVNFKHLTAVTLLQKLQPIFAIILARVLLKEKLKKHTYFGDF
ncbi:integral membrane protein [Fusobacterium animalis ATCC 51191]|uniref:Integral membrane protein n=1 Tax=Fusobacterium animalis ATCC 51191 TaxID=997347 RepID=F9EKL2_9FUSO|nr:integral membrane protein [Fusobacterium animalis ATCC 51191]